MENIEMEVSGTILTLRVDLSDARYANKKNITVATTGGEVGVPGTDVRLKLYVYKPLPARFLK